MDCSESLDCGGSRFRGQWYLGNHTGLIADLMFWDLARAAGGEDGGPGNSEVPGGHPGAGHHNAGYAPPPLPSAPPPFPPLPPSLSPPSTFELAISMSGIPLLPPSTRGQAVGPAGHGQRVTFVMGSLSQ